MHIWNAEKRAWVFSKRVLPFRSALLPCTLYQTPERLSPVPRSCSSQLQAMFHCLSQFITLLLPLDAMFTHPTCLYTWLFCICLPYNISPVRIWTGLCLVSETLMFSKCFLNHYNDDSLPWHSSIFVLGSLLQILNTFVFSNPKTPITVLLLFPFYRWVQEDYKTCPKSQKK